ncbi:hypothetical protein [Herpetosiphon llansteffanensis]|uniref:hypothetical protein n=1 Tax=Herpetosiphon llansteffanensis TaxID=2094568 RepID=UPI000D7C73C1|nr:hypothetical protein [Herpetosiphon llansteffanensis]
MANVPVTVNDARRNLNGLNVTDNGLVVGATDTYFIPNNGRVVLLVTSTPGCTVTVQTPGSVDGLPITDLTASVGAAKQHIIGPFPTTIYNQADGTIQVTFSAAATLYAGRV